ncbi:MAG: hypothetical protein ACFE9L_19515 [Candidatus Hodarchaeota archaeon]
MKIEFIVILRGCILSFNVVVTAGKIKHFYQQVAAAPITKH